MGLGLLVNLHPLRECNEINGLAVKVGVASLFAGIIEGNQWVRGC